MRPKLLRAGTAGAALCLVFAPAALAGGPKPTKQDVREAQRECKAERGTTDASREAFRLKYGSLGLRHCIKVRAREAASERATAVRNAVQQCKAERAQDPQAFLEKYGTNRNRRNALGKCVSAKVRALLKEQDAQDREEIQAERNAAQQCAAERAQDPQAFSERYGTNRNKRNAFGKCVSQRAHASEGSGQSQQPDGSGGTPTVHGNGSAHGGAPSSAPGEGSSSPQVA